MSTGRSTINSLDAGQERRWFRAWVVMLVAFFVIAGGMALIFQWRAVQYQALKYRQLMDPDAADPGLTAPDDTSSEGAPVEVGVYLERIPELNTRDSAWTAVFDVWFRWRGDHFDPANVVVMEGTVEAREKLAEHHDGSSHYERHRFTVRFDKVFEVAQLPLDRHLLLLAIENGDKVRDKMLFVPDAANIGISSRVKIPGYRIVAWQAIEKPHSYKTTRGDPRLPAGRKSTHSQFRLGISIERASWGLYLKMFQALHIAVVIAFLACFIKPTDVDPRFGLGVGALFAAVANSYLVHSFVPDTGEFTLADIVNGLGIMAILVTLIESTVSLYLYDRCGEQELSGRLDRVSFKILVAGFLMVNLALLVAPSL